MFLICGMRRIDDKELHFLMRLGLQRLPKSLLRDIQSGNQVKRDAALNIAADLLLGQFTRHEIYAPDTLKQHG